MDLRGLEQTPVEIGEDDGRTLLASLLARSDAPSLAHFVRSLVGMDRAAAQEAFSELLSNRSLTTPQIRFIEMVIDQLTARGVMEPSALYEAPFSSVHAGGPEALFAGKSNVIEGSLREVEDPSPRDPGRGRLKRRSQGTRAQERRSVTAGCRSAAWCPRPPPHTAFRPFPCR